MKPPQKRPWKKYGWCTASDFFPGFQHWMQNGVIMWYHLLYSRFQVYRTTHWKDNYYVTITYDVDVISIYQSFLSSCISWNSQLVQLWSALAWHPARMATPRNSTHHATIPGATVAGLFSFSDVYTPHLRKNGFKQYSLRSGKLT